MKPLLLQDKAICVNNNSTVTDNKLFTSAMTYRKYDSIMLSVIQFMTVIMKSRLLVCKAFRLYINELSLDSQVKLEVIWIDWDTPIQCYESRTVFTGNSEIFAN